MIDYKSLRPGNWVLFENRHFKMYLICEEEPGLDTTEFGPGVVDWVDLFPIPLTEELLLKTGFKSDPISKIIKCYDKKVSVTLADSEYLGVSENNSKSGYYYLSFRQGDETDFNRLHLNDFVFLRRDLQYLHELQNIVYLLTGEELEINL